VVVIAMLTAIGAERDVPVHATAATAAIVG
jgi:hypothetical protein